MFVSKCRLLCVVCFRDFDAFRDFSCFFAVFVWLMFADVVVVLLVALAFVVALSSLFVPMLT